jgi:BirA family transcriptional regulator, biotin operon repressor / biotin---[acetyl-CoA-carboxylase] ligase
MIDIVRLMREAPIAKIEHHPTLSSTNDRAAQCAARGAEELPLLIIADEQTAGRGRDAKRWWSSSGSLMFSLLVEAKTVAADKTRSPLAALATAVAVVETVAPLLPGHRVGIHWPNDVYVAAEKRDGDRKLAGILVEVLPNRRHVIGIGLNVNNVLGDAPAELHNKVATLYSLTGHRCDRTTVLIDLLRHLTAEYARLCDNAASVAARANQVCLQCDHNLTFLQGGKKTPGRCLGIAADGALQLETASGIESFYSGTTAE